jgi:hypothetical protein
MTREGMQAQVDGVVAAVSATAVSNFETLILLEEVVKLFRAKIQSLTTLTDAQQVTKLNSTVLALQVELAAEKAKKQKP